MPQARNAALPFGRRYAFYEVFFLTVGGTTD
jgi:hypothetical protein